MNIPNYQQFIRFMSATLAMLAVLSGCATYPYDEQATTPVASSDLAGEDKIRSHCEKERAGDWSAIAFCVERRTEGFRDVQRFMEEHNIQDGDKTPEAEILAECSGGRTNPYGHTDWPAIAFCVERQWAGYRKLHP
jgi:hypothetical protein